MRFFGSKCLISENHSTHTLKVSCGMSQEKHLRFQYLVVNYERTKLALDLVASSGAGRSGVRLSTGTCQDLVNWHSSFFYRKSCLTYPEGKLCHTS